MASQHDKQNGTVANGTSTSTSNNTVICVFCGSSPGKSPAHLSAARALAAAFHAASITLIYGGGTVGLMGELARTLVSLSGPSSVHGIIPSALMRYEQSDPSSPSSEPTIDEAIYGRTTVVKDMHTRKAMMAAEVGKGGPGSGFVALSGGFGTLEELMEIATWNQLGIHGRGVCVFNVEGYWDGLLKWVREAVEAGFISEANGGIVVSGETPEEVIGRLREYRNSKDRFELTWEAEGAP